LFTKKAFKIKRKPQLKVKKLNLIEMAQIVYDDIYLTFDVLSQNLYRLSSNDFIVETHKIGELDENDSESRFKATLVFGNDVDKELMDNSFYVARGICMDDRDIIIVSFGGPIGKFDTKNVEVNGEIDKEVENVVHFYLQHFLPGGKV